MASLRPSEGRVHFDIEPVNRLAAYSSRPAPQRQWAILAHERKYACSVFIIGDFQVAIEEEAQHALKEKVLDLVDGRIVASPV
jgi:hypothetical protein